MWGTTGKFSRPQPCLGTSLPSLQPAQGCAYATGEINQSNPISLTPPVGRVGAAAPLRLLGGPQVTPKRGMPGMAAALPRHPPTLCFASNLLLSFRHAKKHQLLFGSVRFLRLSRWGGVRARGPGAGVFSRGPWRWPAGSGGEWEKVSGSYKSTSRPPAPSPWGHPLWMRALR